LANDLKAGSLVRSVEVELRWARIATEVRTALLGIPSRLKGRRPNLTSEDLRVIDEMIRETLTGLADRGAGNTEREAEG
jgi:phage terminase Nu1 subunit (DNA packaging protein)